MAREYALGGLTKHKTASGLVWRGRIIWREGAGDKWHHMSKVLTDDGGSRIPARPGDGDNRGRATAERALQAWRESLVEQYAEAERQAAEAARRAETEAERVSVPDYVDGRLDALEALHSVEASTMRAYRNTARLIRWEFADTALQDLTRAMVEAFDVRIMSGEDYRCQPEGVKRRPAGARTVGKANMLLKSVCQHAVDVDELIPKNPVSGIKPPRNKPTDKNAMDAESRARFVAYLETHVATPVVTGAALALLASLGPGESCALRWRDVDLDSATIRVSGAIGDGKGGTYVKAPKVASRRRTVDIPAQLVDVLGRRRRLAEAECVAAGVPLTGDMFVLGDATGAYLAPITLSRGWAAIADAEGYRGTHTPRVRLYDLRHTFATVAVANHVDIETVSSMMGHSNVAQTLNTYASADPQAKRAAARTIEEAYGKVLPLRAAGAGE